MKDAAEGIAAFAVSLLYLAALIVVCLIPMAAVAFVLGLLS